MPASPVRRAARSSSRLAYNAPHVRRVVAPRPISTQPDHGGRRRHDGVGQSRPALVIRDVGGRRPLHARRCVRRPMGRQRRPVDTAGAAAARASTASAACRRATSTCDGNSPQTIASRGSSARARQPPARPRRMPCTWRSVAWRPAASITTGSRPWATARVPAAPAPRPLVASSRRHDSASSPARGTKPATSPRTRTWPPNARTSCCTSATTSTSTAGNPATRVARPFDQGEIITLADYRRRYAQYRLDPDLQALHAIAPFAVVFDDHEVDNNWAGDIPEDRQTRQQFLDASDRCLPGAPRGDADAARGRAIRFVVAHLPRTRLGRSRESLHARHAAVPRRSAVWRRQPRRLRGAPHRDADDARDDTGAVAAIARGAIDRALGRARTAGVLRRSVAATAPTAASRCPWIAGTDMSPRASA